MTAYRERLIRSGYILPLEARPTLRLDDVGVRKARTHAALYELHSYAASVGVRAVHPADLPWEQDPEVMP